MIAIPLLFLGATIRRDRPNEVFFKGAVLHAFLNNLHAEDTRHILALAHIDTIDDDKMYPQALLVMLYQAVEALPNGIDKVIAVGEKTVDYMSFNDTVIDIPSALATLKPMYEQMHIGLRGDEGWHLYDDGDHRARAIMKSPYSQYAAYGYLYGLMQRFRTPDTRFSVMPQTKNDGSPTIFHLKWMP